MFTKKRSLNVFYGNNLATLTKTFVNFTTLKFNYMDFEEEESTKQTEPKVFLS